MTSDEDSLRRVQHLNDRPESEHADYLKMLGRWARGDPTSCGPSGPVKKAMPDARSEK